MTDGDVYVVVETQRGGRQPFYGSAEQSAHQEAGRYAQTVEGTILRIEERRKADDAVLRRGVDLRRLSRSS
jgi:hypothetical protein